jgi:hypothetical protein
LDFYRSLGKVSRRERKGIQLGLGFIVLNVKMLNGAEILCAPLREPLRTLR